ncbi:MAG: hypothetical protein PUF50_03460 [Erysipelotrichaceae bacterium]|nr:hypothetical protein [Erysipelotrichaceae bacterium]
MKKMKLYFTIVFIGLSISFVIVFAHEETLETYGDCSIIKEENGCYLLQDNNGDTEWVCEEKSGDSSISPYGIKCTFDCWNND